MITIVIIDATSEFSIYRCVLPWRGSKYQKLPQLTTINANPMIV